MSTGTTRANHWLDSFTLHGESETYRAEFDAETTSASVAVIGALSEVLATDPTDIEPLYETIETDALDEIVHHKTATGDVEVSFLLEGRKVTVYGYGMVAIEARPADRDDPSDGGPSE